MWNSRKNFIVAANGGTNGLRDPIEGCIAGNMAESVIDLLEVVDIDHGEGVFAHQILQPVIVVAAIVDFCGGVNVDLPVPHQQLIDDTFLRTTAHHVAEMDGIDAFQRVGMPIYLNTGGDNIVHLVAYGFYFADGLVRTDGFQ